MAWTFVFNRLIEIELVTQFYQGCCVYSVEFTGDKVPLATAGNILDSRQRSLLSSYSSWTNLSSSLGARCGDTSTRLGLAVLFRFFTVSTFVCIGFDFGVGTRVVAPRLTHSRISF